MKEQTKIYRLLDPRTDQTMYIGKTTSSIKSRIAGHVCSSRQTNTTRDVWIRELMSLNLKPLYDIIEYVDHEKWPEREEYWIKFYREINPNLCNLSLGPGQLGLKRSIEEIQIMSKLHSIPVYQLTFDFKIIKLHPSCTQAAKNINKTNPMNISTSARSKGIKSAFGYIWIYFKDYNDWKNNENRKVFTRNREHLYHPVNQYDLNMNLIKTWPSHKIAAKELGIRWQGISRCNIGYRPNFKGFIWKNVNQGGEINNKTNK